VRRAGRRAGFEQLLIQPLATTHQGPEDGFRRGCQTPLEDGEGEPDRAHAPTCRFGPVELAAHVVRYGLVKLRLARRELIADGVRVTLREEVRAVELLQVLLDHPAHEVAHVGAVGFLAETPLETVLIQ
jgi:hypothetical protein